MKIKTKARYWWAEHLPIHEEHGMGSYTRTKFKPYFIYFGKEFDRYIDPEEQEIDICDSRYSNFGFNKKKLIPDEIYCCDRRSLLLKRSFLRKVIYYNRVVECGTIYTINRLFPAFSIKTFRSLQKNGFLPPPNLTIGPRQYYFLEHIMAFAKVYNDLILQGVFHPTIKKNTLHHAWLLKEWEAATKKIYDKPLKEEMDFAEKHIDYEYLNQLREVVWT